MTWVWNEFPISMMEASEMFDFSTLCRHPSGAVSAKWPFRKLLTSIQLLLKTPIDVKMGFGLEKAELLIFDHNKDVRVIMIMKRVVHTCRPSSFLTYIIKQLFSLIFQFNLCDHFLPTNAFILSTYKTATYFLFHFAINLTTCY